MFLSIPSRRCCCSILLFWNRAEFNDRILGERATSKVVCYNAMYAPARLPARPPAHTQAHTFDIMLYKYMLHTE